MKHLRIAAASALCACSWSSKSTRTQAEERSGYNYVPIDPMPAVEESPACDTSKQRLLGVIESLPDSAVRTLVEQVDESGNVKFGAGMISEKGSAFRVTVDFINTTTVSVPFLIKKTAEIYGDKNHTRETISLWEETKGRYAIGSERYVVFRQESTIFRLQSKAASSANINEFTPINIPVYVGLGIRVKSAGTTLAGNVDISGLAAIGFQAEAKTITGSLVAQTLGISGKSVTSALPLHSDLNMTATTDAIGAAGSIKAQLFSSDTVVSPRVVGFYLPLVADVALINAVVSALSDGTAPPLKWSRPCVPKESQGPVLLSK
ncbi:MAG: hypothetical protein ACM3PC_06770 [Deltaproteobacteria bacterium]